MNIPPAIVLNFRVARMLEPYKDNRGHYQFTWVDERIIRRCIANLEDIVMPSKFGNRKNGYNAEETKFINYRLNEDEAKRFGEWASKHEQDMITEIALFMADGVKTSVTWDSSNNCWIISSTCVDEDSDNHRCCLTSRSNDWFEALAMNTFKAKVICAKKPWQELSQANNWG